MDKYVPYIFNTSKFMGFMEALDYDVNVVIFKQDQNINILFCVVKSQCSIDEQFGEYNLNNYIHVIAINMFSYMLHKITTNYDCIT